MTQADLIDLIAAALVRSHGRSRRHWRIVLGRVRTYPLSTHPSCNWSIDPTGTPGDVEAAQQALDRMRAEHPFVEHR
jgi:hypothetical protein